MLTLIRGTVSTVLLALLFLTNFTFTIKADVLVGVFRWDHWTSANPEISIFNEGRWRARVPFFAELIEGRIQVAGDLEHVLAAETIYARSAGVDYFIFGYYPETPTWGRDETFQRGLNRALSTFLRLPNRNGIKFAVSINQAFALSDLGEQEEAITSLLRNPDYIRTQSGSLPVFIYTSDAGELQRVYGSLQRAAYAYGRLRRAIRLRLGVNVHFVLLRFQPQVASEQAEAIGASAISTYSTFAPGQGPSSFAACGDHSRQHWRRALNVSIGFLPNLTVGWDSEPREAYRRTRGEASQERRGWCLPPTSEELVQLVRDAVSAARSSQRNESFQSVVIYAWNEFTEGGWIAPTWAGHENLSAIRIGLERNVAMGPVELTWPRRDVGPESCPVRTGARPAPIVEMHCRRQLPPTAISPLWPCPPGMRVISDRLRAPTGLEALHWAGAWQDRVCSQ